MSLTPEETAVLMASVRLEIRKALADVQVATRLTINRGTVNAVNDEPGIQELQCTALQDEVLDEVEHFQGYGFTAHPPTGSEVCLATVGDDRAHMIALAVNSRADRCAGLAVGEVCMHSIHGQEIRMIDGKSFMTLTVTKAGARIQLGDDSASDPVALSFLVHRSLDLITATITGWAAPLPDAAPVTGAQMKALAAALVAAVNTPISVPPGTGPFVGASKILGV